ncbi:MAG: hypothetical protein OHK0052_12880 [Anaerolineales bacterium]
MNRTRLALWGSLLWSLLVVLAYFAVHKPISPDQLPAPLRLLLDLSIVFALLTLAGGLGAVLMPLNHRPKTMVGVIPKSATGASAALQMQIPPYETESFKWQRAALQVALGLGILALQMLILGFLGGYRPWVFWLLLIVGFALFRRQSLQWLRDLWDARPQFAPKSPLERTLALLNAALLLPQILYAAAPPTKWDALMYHLEIPRRYLEAGRFIFLPENPYWGNPQLGHLLYTLAYGLRGAETAALLSAAVFIFALLMLFSTSVQHESAWIVLSALLVGQSLRATAGWAYVDVFALFYGAILWLCFQELAAHITRSALCDAFDKINVIHGILTDPVFVRRLIWMAGISAGLAAVSKLTAALLLPLLLIGFIMLLSIKRSPKYTLPKPTVLGASLLAVGIFSVWLLVSLYYTGNPLYPQIFPTAHISPARLNYFAYTANRLPLAWHTTLLPLSATFLGLEAAALEGNYPVFGADIGPLLLLFAVPGAFLLIHAMRTRRDFLTAFALLWLSTGWLAMLIGGFLSPLLWQTRLYFALFPALAFAVSQGWQALTRLTADGVRLKRILVALVLLVLSLNLWQETVTLARTNPLAVLTGAESPQTYLERQLGAYFPAVQALPPESRALFLWEPRGLYAPVTASPDVWIDRWYLTRHEPARTPDQILAEWRAQGYTHLLINRPGAEFEFENRAQLTPADAESLQTLLNALPLAQDFGGAYQIYRLTP